MTEKDYKTALRMITYERIHLLRDVDHRSIQRIADDLGLNFRKRPARHVSVPIESRCSFAQFGEVCQVL